MNNINEKINAENIKNNDRHLLNKIYKFLQTCLVEHIYFLIIALRQIFFQTKDISPIIAGFSFGFLIFVTYYLVKIRKNIVKNKQ